MKRMVFDAANQQMEVTISKPELAVRFIEAITETARPNGQSSVSLLLDLKKKAPDVYEQACALADVAADYFTEAVQLAYDEREQLKQ